MKQKLLSDNRGVAHVVLVAIIAVVVAAGGFAAYRVISQNNDSDTANNASSSQNQASSVPCESDDKDLCKFFSSWKASSQYRTNITAEDGSKSTYEIDGDKSRVAMTMEGNAYEVITIGSTTYTKAGETWYKQTIQEENDNVAQDYEVDFNEPTNEEAAEDKTTYKKLGKEACGDLTCFKYEVIEHNQANEKQYIWFDDKDYRLQRMQTVGEDGTTEMTFEYSGVTVSEPSPVQELGPNQYIAPGQSEPTTLPDLSQYQQ